MTRLRVTVRFGLPARVGVFSPSPDALEEVPVFGRDRELRVVRGEVLGASDIGVDGTDLSNRRVPNQLVLESGRGARYSAAIW